MKVYIEFTNGDHESFESGEFWVYTAEEMDEIKAVKHPGMTLINADAIRLMVAEPESKTCKTDN